MLKGTIDSDPAAQPEEAEAPKEKHESVAELIRLEAQRRAGVSVPPNSLVSAHSMPSLITRTVHAPAGHLREGPCCRLLPSALACHAHER